jgi:hypothetical protein
LNDSAAGLAAWIIEKGRTWSDCDGDVEHRFTKGELLTTVTICWVTETIGSSFRIYYDWAPGSPPTSALAQGRKAPVGVTTPLPQGQRIEVPTAVVRFPADVANWAPGVGREGLRLAALD